MANLTNSAKLIEEMSKKAYKTELPTVNNATVTVAVNGSTWTNSFTTNQASNSTLKITVGKSDVGLWNVDNTSDANKPISTATQAALDLKADKSEISSVYKYKGSKANYDALPSSWNTTWDVWNVEAAHTTAPVFPAWSNLAWDGSAWDVLGWTVDLSNYVDKSTNQTIWWTKTFSTSPIVPSKTTDAANTWTAIATEAQVYKKQNTLVSWDNIKTVNNQSLLWSWNITIESWWIQNDATWTTTTVTKIRAWTEVEYALITPNANTIYYIF